MSGKKLQGTSRNFKELQGTSRNFKELQGDIQQILDAILYEEILVSEKHGCRELLSPMENMSKEQSNDMLDGFLK
jgi:hypothetical protein